MCPQSPYISQVVEICYCSLRNLHILHLHNFLLEYQENDKKDDTAADAALKKKDDSDSEEEQDAQPKEKGISNKKKKVNFNFYFAVMFSYFCCSA